MLPLKPFYIIRHGQSVANANTKFAGHLDSPLTALGRTQAAAARDIVQNLPLKPTRLISSTLSRAYETASIINEALGLKHETHEGLKEMFVGDWEEQPFDLYRERFFAGENPPNGETHDGFMVRVGQTLTHILNGADALPLIVCHGGVIFKIGRLYGHTLGHVENAVLYHFAPAPHLPHFPWVITEFTPDGRQIPAFE